MTTYTEQQKACPFCGSTDISEGEVLTTLPGDRTATQSMCRQCGALGPEAILPHGQIDFGSEKAIVAWNRRAPDAAAWRELTRRLYVELFHCDQQMRSTRDEEGEPHWTQSTVVRDVLADAKKALELNVAPDAKDAQGEPVMWFCADRDGEGFVVHEERYAKDCERDGLDVTPLYRAATLPRASDAPAATPATDTVQLESFLDGCAGEGLVINGIDAADLYVKLFPAEYAAALAAGESGSVLNSDGMVSRDWKFTADRTAAPATAAHAGATSDLAMQISRMRKDETRGDTVFRCGFNGAIDAVLKLLTTPTAAVDDGVTDKGLK